MKLKGREMRLVKERPARTHLGSKNADRPVAHTTAKGNLMVDDDESLEIAKEFFIHVVIKIQEDLLCSTGSSVCSILSYCIIVSRMRYDGIHAHAPNKLVF